MPEDKQVPEPNQLGRPSARDTVARARAAAAPVAAKASAAAGPAVEKAAGKAGKLLGTLRSRAQETVKEFTDAYGKDEHDTSATSTQDAPTANNAPPAGARKRPRPGPS
jgi:hypothetical protein